MKKLLILFCGIFPCLFLNAQLRLDIEGEAIFKNPIGNSLTISPYDNNLGIEIRTVAGIPFIDLSDDGAVDFDARIGLENNILTFRSNDANSTIAKFVIPENVNKYIAIGNDQSKMNLGIGAATSTNGVPYIWSSSDKFMIGSDGNPTVFINAMSNGNVGIGTTSPEYKLMVQENSGKFWAGYFGNDDVGNEALGGLHSFVGGTGTGNKTGIKGLVRAAGQSIYGVLGEVFSETGGTDEQTLYGVKGHAERGISSYEGGDKYGIHGTADGSNGRHYGVYGVADGVGGTGTICYGVYGKGNGFAINYGVYGATAINTSFVGSAAGYFQGDLTYTGTLNNPSDKKLKKSIIDVKDGMELIMNLRPVNYNFKTNDYNYMNLPEGKQWGFVAQEVEKILPNLVQENLHPKEPNNKSSEMEYLEYKSINYIGLIPVLTKAIQEQHQAITDKEEKIEELRMEVEELKRLVNTLIDTKGESIQAVVIENARLGQNMPNPFNSSTRIPYSIPQNSNKAVIEVHGINGQLIKTIPINTFGEGIVELQTQNLSNGQYTYTLEVDGRVIDTKKMNLVK